MMQVIASRSGMVQEIRVVHVLRVLAQELHVCVQVGLTVRRMSVRAWCQWSPRGLRCRLREEAV